MRWLDKLKVRVRSFWRQHIVGEEPLTLTEDFEHQRLPSQALFIVQGRLMDLEGLRMWAHGQMYPSSVRKQTWN